MWKKGSESAGGQSTCRNSTRYESKRGQRKDDKKEVEQIKKQESKSFLPKINNKIEIAIKV